MVQIRGRVIGALLVALWAGGCRCSMIPGKMSWVQPHSDADRAGNIYLVRGFIGLFSQGIDELTDQLNAGGVRAHVFQDDQYRELGRTLVERYRGNAKAEPLCLIGHSFGADDVVRIARQLDEAGVTVDLLITLDPTERLVVPKNVKACYNFYLCSWEAMPAFHGMPLKAEEGSSGQVVNFNLSTDRADLLEWDTNHVNVDKNSKVHREVLEKVMAVCPPRGQ